MKKRLKIRRPSHGTVIAYIALFAALGGGAMAASNLSKNSVGTKQLKKNSVTKVKIRKKSVTSPKIKKGAVNRSKIKKDAVNGAKIADNTVTGSEINAATTPFSRVVHRARGSAAVPLLNESPVLFPLPDSTYTQEAGRDDTYFGVMEITFEPSCTAPRAGLAYILLDAPNPLAPDETNVVAFGAASDDAGGTVSKRISLGPYIGGSFAPNAPLNHTLSLVTFTNCEGATSGATATYGGIDVIGVK
jgi:hypothetical protein